MQNHQPQWHYLIKRWQQNNLPHALLLIGDYNSEKLNFATQFAKTVLCLEKIEMGCGVCRNCLLMQAHSYPDFYHIEPEEQGKAIRIDQIRELITQLNQTAQQNNYRIAIIEPAHALNLSASNALLKTLEEPNNNILIFLLSTQPSLLPATIRSRCQIVRFPIANKISESNEEQEKLLIDLKNIVTNQQDPLKIAANFAKANLDEVIDNLIYVLMRMIRANIKQNLFLFLDKLYEVKRNILISNPNQQLLLEDLFCSWYHYART